MEAAVAEAPVLHQRPAHLPRAYQHDAVGSLQPEDVADPGGQLDDAVAQPALAERAEEGEVFADLGRRGAAQLGQLSRGDGGAVASLRGPLLEEPEVERQPAHRAVGDLPHCELFHIFPTPTQEPHEIGGGQRFRP